MICDIAQTVQSTGVFVEVSFLQHVNTVHSLLTINCPWFFFFPDTKEKGPVK